MDPLPALKASMLDRLIDPDSAGTVARRGYSLEDVLAVVQRDLESLLNTRATYMGLPEEYRELHNSIYTYGLPDLAALVAITPAQRAEVGQLLEEVVRRFEPRLRNVQAKLLDPGDDKDRTVRFRIDATLHMDPSPDIVFETVLELGTGHYSVQPAST